MKFQVLINRMTNKDFVAFKLSDVTFIMLIDVKMPTIVVGILTFISMIISCSVELSMILFYILEAWIYLLG